MYSIAEDEGYWDEYQAAKRERDEARAVLVALLEAVAPILGTSDDWQDGDSNPRPVQAALAEARRAAGLGT